RRELPEVDRRVIPPHRLVELDPTRDLPSAQQDCPLIPPPSVIGRMAQAPQDECQNERPGQHQKHPGHQACVAIADRDAPCNHRLSICGQGALTFTVPNGTASFSARSPSTITCKRSPPRAKSYIPAMS